MIDKLLRAKVVAGIAAAVLLAGGVAFAATDGGPRPTVSQDEVASSTSTSMNQATSTSVDDGSTSTTMSTESTSTTLAGAGVTTSTEPEHEADHPDNHGACVSQAAHDTPPGPDHGKTVSAVAQSDCGKDQAGATSTTATTENENEQHGSQSGGHGNSGGDHGNSGSGGSGQE